MTRPNLQRAACTLPPFPSFPSAARHVAVGSTDEAVERLCRGIETGEAIGLVVGPPGIGKSQVCQVLAERMGETMTVIQLADGSIASSAGLNRILARQLDVQSTGDCLHEAIVERMEQPGGRRLLLILDEAQGLPAEVLESVRRLTNVLVGGVRQMTAILSGSPALEETLADPVLQSLVQRIATRCYLHPMNNDQTARYITETVTRLGGQVDETIRPAAIDAIHQACSGVPRLVNQLMTLAIDVADESPEELITVAVVERAWAALQQLPASSPTATAGRPSGAVASTATIEFGSLRESVDEPNDVGSDIAPVELTPLTLAITPDVDSLFGNFEEEEPILQRLQRVREQAVTLAPPASDPTAMKAADLPPVVVDQVADAVDNQLVDDQPIDNQFVDDKAEEELVQVQTDVLHLQRFAQAHATPEPMAKKPFAPPPFAPVLWLSEDGGSIDAGMIDDDRDLLVIEDQVAVEVAPAPPVSEIGDEEESASTIDFRSLLEKMRRPQAV